MSAKLSGQFKIPEVLSKAIAVCSDQSLPLPWTSPLLLRSCTVRPSHDPSSV
jgi:hypothetical protein